jgi:hypothetical protein
VLITIINTTMGIEKEEQPKDPPQGTSGFQDSTEVYNYIHMEKWD